MRPTTPTRQHKLPLIIALFFGVVFITVSLLWIRQVSQHAARSKTTEGFIQQMKQVRTTPTTDLQTFLDAEVSGHSGCPAAQPGTTLLQGQLGDYAFLRYGCGNADSPMYVTKRSGSWRTITPTNQFVGEIPRCEMIARYGIPQALYQAGCYKQSRGGDPDIYGTIVAKP